MSYDFVPWGGMCSEYDAGLALPPPTRLCDRNAVPTPGLWVPWLDQTADELAAFLWPRWNGAVWVGSSAATAMDLTLTDIDVMSDLAPLLARTAPGAVTGVTSKALFLAEDGDPPSVVGLQNYLPAIPQPLLANFRNWVLEAVRDFGLGGALQLKVRMQRPRAYQTALALKPGAGFVHQKAVSADTPSMISGHCFQASLAFVNVAIRYEQALGSAAPASDLDALGAYLLGAGDRRVLAGVHYPSDNVSSWFSALRLCRTLLFATTPGDPVANAPLQMRARRLLWDAVTRFSAVYAAIAAEAERPGSAYGPALARLQAEAVSP